MLRLCKREKDNLDKNTTFCFETEIKDRELTTYAEIKNLYNEIFSKYTSLGAYSLIFLSEKPYGVLCADCAKKAFILKDNKTIASDCYFEGPIFECDECGEEIESAYGDPSKDDDNED